MKSNKQQDDVHAKNTLEEMGQAVEDWKNKYMRALADYKNLEKRTEEEKQEVRLYANRIFLEKLLPVVDNLERAEAHIQDEGLSIAMKELHMMLARHGVEKLEVVDAPFDPYTMECVEVIQGKKDVVLSVVSPGYTMHGKLLREAKVKVGGGET